MALVEVLRMRPPSAERRLRGGLLGDVAEESRGVAGVALGEEAVAAACALICPMDSLGTRSSRVPGNGVGENTLWNKYSVATRMPEKPPAPSPPHRSKV